MMHRRYRHASMSVLEQAVDAGYRRGFPDHEGVGNDRPTDCQMANVVTIPYEMIFPL